MASFATRPSQPDQPKKASTGAGAPGQKKAPNTRPSATKVEPSRSNKGTLVLIGAFVAMAAVAVLVAVLTTGNDKPKEEAGLSQTQPISVDGTLTKFTADDDGGGQKSPIISGKTFAGSSVSAPEPGRATLIAFVAHWCPHCQKEVPLITKWANDGGLKGVDLVAVATGTSKASANYPPSAWLTREQWPGKVIADDDKGTAAQAFGLDGYPYLVFIDANGVVKARMSGEKTTDDLDTAIAKVAPASTTAN